MDATPVMSLTILVVGGLVVVGLLVAVAVVAVIASGSKRERE
jgi:hypothetical protein